MLARSLVLLASLALTAQASYEIYPVYNTTTPPPAPTGTPQDCEKVRSDCQGKPDANQAQCAALYVACAGTTSGLNHGPPETTAVYTVYTTVCPATMTTGNVTHVYTTTQTVTSCVHGCPTTPPMITYPANPPPAETYPPAPPTGPKDCEKVRSDCQIKPDANQATCAAIYAACVGTPPAAPPAPPAPSGPKDCEKVRSDCQIKPDANQATCAALYAACAGTTSGLNKPPAATYPVGTGVPPHVPTSTVPDIPTFTGAASALKPALAGLVAVAGFVVLA